MSGIFYGVGVGPGDPELLTVKAVRVIESCGVLAVPISDDRLKEPVLISKREGAVGEYREFLERCAAYQIIRAAGLCLEGKPVLYLPMPMKKERAILDQIHDRCAEIIGKLLAEGKVVACITIGDPTVYSTCVYMQKRILKLGYETCFIPGVPSFCAAAARMNMGLVEGSEELHVLPASYEIEEGLELPGTKVLMKAGRKLAYVKEAVRGKGVEIGMVENCGMEGERIYHAAEEIPEKTSYYSLMIVKEGNNRR
ncbi:MAG: precorrin-2 C(20)-methyltransferase [Hespellia sp.]|jgi:precorrin-2/cobalt-factor-2 C20-methyltransferase|nr:precorrin-2 C(20)-methyltransferase [Hespellia sp.]